MTAYEVQRDQFSISTDPSRLDIPLVHHWLSDLSYWAQGRSLETVQQSMAHSLCFGLYESQSQVGFARVVTDYATFAWLCDVFIQESHRGRGLGKWLIKSVVSHPMLQHGLFLLATQNAHGLYERYGGFVPLWAADRWMARPKTT